jgi:hypothetical protein
MCRSSSNEAPVIKADMARVDCSRLTSEVLVCPHSDMPHICHGCDCPLFIGEGWQRRYQLVWERAQVTGN